ncbi:type VII secretion protein EccE [Kribbella sp. NPDC051936]|uniref:type VII secretion protein EccE n=1 Tax=Kribbella sp. NPDC051936 TaxID=3154946 RepID=UPI0034385FD7
MQLVCWEVALGAAAGLAGRGPATDVVAGLVVVGVFGVTATGWRGLWCFQWIRLALGYLLRGPRFVAVEAYRGRLELGDVDAGTVIRPDGVTVLLETDVPPDAAPADLVEDRTDLRIKLIRRPGRAWIAITAVRSVDRRENTELDLLMSNTVRRLTKRLHRRGLRAEPLGPSDLTNLLASLTPKQISEEWDALDLGTGRYRMYAVPPHLALQQAGAVTVTTSSDLDHALVVAHADAPQGPDAVHQTGRQRAAFLAALP